MRGGGAPPDFELNQVGEGALSGAGMGALYGATGSAFGSAFRGLSKGIDERKTKQRSSIDSTSIDDKLNDYNTRRNQYTDQIDEKNNSILEQTLDDLDSINNEKRDKLGQTGVIKSSDTLTGKKVVPPASFYVDPFHRNPEMANDFIIGKKDEYGLNQYGRFDRTAQPGTEERKRISKSRKRNKQRR